MALLRTNSMPRSPVMAQNQFVQSISDLKVQPFPSLIESADKLALETALRTANSRAASQDLAQVVNTIGDKLQAQNKQAVHQLGALSVPEMLRDLLMTTESRVSASDCPLRFDSVAFYRLDKNDNPYDEPEDEFARGEVVLTDSRLMFLASEYINEGEFQVDPASLPAPRLCTGCPCAPPLVSAKEGQVYHVV